MAFVIPGVICLVCAVAFVALVPREEEAPAKRKPKMIDLPPAVMARVFVIMTFTAVTGSIIFNFTTNGNGEMLSERVKGCGAIRPSSRSCCSSSSRWRRWPSSWSAS